MSNFEVVKSIETDFDIKITKFKSKATGLIVILVDRQGISFRNRNGVAFVTVY
jgi:hypothetical protein